MKNQRPYNSELATTMLLEGDLEGLAHEVAKPNRQPDLFDRTYRARTADPQTSHAAARQVNIFANTHYRKIYEALQTMKDGTFYEIADRCGLQPPSVWRRLPELERNGFIQTTGEERRGPTNRLCRVWRSV